MSVYQELYDKHGYCPPGVGMKHASDHLPVLEGLQRGSVLELGAGRGEMVDWAKANGFSPVIGVDIAKTGHPDVIGGFDFTKQLSELASLSYTWVWSFDVLEHLQPEQIQPVIMQARRLATHGQIHAVYTCADVRNGVELHTCRKPVEWWVKQFGVCKVLPCLRRDRFWLFHKHNGALYE